MTTSEPSPDALIDRAHSMAGALTALVIAGCTYAPPALHVSITNHVMAPDGGRVAFAVLATRSRAATGLSAFPDGGVPLTLNEAAAVYTCDTATLRLHDLDHRSRRIPPDRLSTRS